MVLVLSVVVFVLISVCTVHTSFCSQVFTLSSTTQVFGNNPKHTLNFVETQATFKLYLLKHESFFKLFSLKVDDCRPSPCADDAREYLISFENETITHIYGKLDNTSAWSVGLAVISLLQPRMEVPRINLGGICESNNEKVDERKIIRNIRFCNFGVQNSIATALNIKSEFEQKVIYEKENKALKRLTAEEIYQLHVPFYSKLSTKVFSKHELTVVANVPDDSELCADFSTVEQCQKHLVADKKFTFISSSAEKLLTAYMGDRVDIVQPSTNDNQPQCIMGSSADLEHLKEVPDKSASKMFVSIIKKCQQFTEADLLACLNLPDNSENSKTLITLLAACGTVNSHNAVKKFVFNIKNAELHESLWSNYLMMLANAPHVDVNVIKDVLEFFRQSTHPVDQTLANSAASLLRRYCSKIAGCEDRSGPTKKMIAVFEAKFLECKADHVECLRPLMRSFTNLRTPHVVNLVKEYLCVDKALSVEALRVLKVLRPGHWSTDEIIDLIWRISANRCPKPQDQTSRTLAGELLLGSHLDKTKVVRTLLTQVSGTSSVEREIFAYLYAKIEQLAAIDDRIQEALEEFKSNHALNNYNTLASGTQSTVVKFDFFESEFGHATYEFDMEFNKGILRRSAADVRIEPFDTPSALLLSFGLYSRGLESMASSFGGGEESNSENIESSSVTDEPTSPTAGMQLSLFDNHLNSLTLFDGEGELMSAIWAANGDRMIALSGTFLLNNLRANVPLLSGHTATVRMQSALALRLSGSVEVSIWYRTSHSVVENQGSVALDGLVEVQSQTGQPIFSHSLALSAKTEINFITDLDFYSNPFQMCLQMEQTPFNIKHKSNIVSYDASNKPHKSSKRSGERKIDGRSFVTLEKMFKSCSTLTSQ